MTPDIDRAADQLRAELAHVAAEHGSTVVSFSVIPGRFRFGLESYEMTLALLSAGFLWHHDNVWRAVIGGGEIDITGTTEDGGTPAP